MRTRLGETRFKLLTAATLLLPDCAHHGDGHPAQHRDFRLLDRQVIDTLVARREHHRFLPGDLRLGRLSPGSGPLRPAGALRRTHGRVGKRKDDGLPLCRPAGGVLASTPPPTTWRAGLLPRGVLASYHVACWLTYSVISLGSALRQARHCHQVAALLPCSVRSSNMKRWASG